MRRLERVRAFGRDPERRAQFCREMSARIGVEVEPANSGEEAVRGAEIVITATSATKNRARRRLARSRNTHQRDRRKLARRKRELDDAAVGRADVVAVDSMEQAKMEAGDLIQAFGEDALALGNACASFPRSSRARVPGESTQAKSLCLNQLELQLGIWLRPCASMN